MIDTATLPDDVQALKALVVKLSAEKAALQHNLNLLIRWQQDSQGQRQPRGPLPQSGQGLLFALELVAEAERTSAAAKTHAALELAPAQPRKPGGRRSKFPEHLPRVTTRYELPQAERVCACGGVLHEIGVETSRELERVEVSVVHLIERVKYACRACEEGVVTTPGPARVIDKGILAPGFLASVLVERFGNHMPYHRLEKKYAAEGLELSRSVLERSSARCAEHLEPVWREVGREVLSSPAIHTDDTGVTVARSVCGESRESKKGHVWVYLDLEGNHFYDFTQTHSRDGPSAVLTGYQGYIHADAASLYDVFFELGAREVACWAHTRRHIEEAASEYPDLAAALLERIGALYGVEREAKAAGLDAEGRRSLRLEHSVPILDALYSQLELAAGEVLPQSKMGHAIRYAQRHKKALRTFLEDGRLSLDNNAAERALRALDLSGEVALPASGSQLRDVALRADAQEHVAEVVRWIQAMSLGRHQQAQQDRRVPAAARR